MALSDYDNIRTALFVKIQVEEYLQSDGGLRPETLLFSDHFADYELNGDTYTALGKLVSVSSTTSELSPSGSTLTIVISGIPNKSVEEIVKSKIKSSIVNVYRGIFTHSGEFIVDESIVNPVGRFSGFVNNYSLDETWDVDNRLSSNTIIIECSSTVSLLSKKTAGRKTNPTSMKKYFPNDTSFDRVPAIVNAEINFGGAK